MKDSEQKKIDEKNRQKAIEKLEETTKLFNQAHKQLEKELLKANSYFIDVTKKAKPEDLTKIVDVKRKVDALIMEAKKGGDINDIIKRINKLAL